MADISLGPVIAGVGVNEANLGNDEMKPIVVWIGPTRGFWIYMAGTHAGNLVTITFRQTINSGVTWLAPVDLVTGLSPNVNIMACWADWWTPGDNGRAVHIIFDSGAVIRYIRFDTIAVTATAPVDVHTHSSATEAMNAAITKARGGDLIIVSTTLSTDRASRSKDGGSTWNDITTPFVGVGSPVNNNIEIYPGNEVNKNDCWGIELDSVGDIPNFLVFDSATDTWTATAFGTVMSGSHAYLSGIINPKNNHLIVAITKNALNVFPLEFWDINGVTSIMQLSDIRETCNGVGAVGLSFREDTGRIYALYPVHDGNAAGFADPAVIKFKFSTDGGLTWSQEDTWNEDPDGMVGVDGLWAGGPIPKLLGGRIQPVWSDTGTGGADNAQTNQAVSIGVSAGDPDIDPIEDCPAAQDEVFMDSSLTCACQKEDTFIAGLDHLEGETVAITVDNATRQSQIVLNGRLSFPDGITPGGTGPITVQVGLAYISELETLPLESTDQGGISVGKLKRVERVRLRLHNSRGGEVAIKTTEGEFDPERNITRKVSDPTSAVPPIFSGPVDLEPEGSGDTDVRIIIRQKEPQPLTVLSITTEVKIDDL